MLSYPVGYTSSIAMMSNAKSHSINAENPNGDANVGVWQQVYSELPGKGGHVYQLHRVGQKLSLKLKTQVL